MSYHHQPFHKHDFIVVRKRSHNKKRQSASSYFDSVYRKTHKNNLSQKEEDCCNMATD